VEIWSVDNISTGSMAPSQLCPQSDYLSGIDLLFGMDLNELEGTKRLELQPTLILGLLW
jgi:hypothetical protein